MKVILLERVANLGNLGDIVEVKNGYARNFLIPTGKAKRATAENMAEFEKNRQAYEAAQAAVLASAQQRYALLDGTVFNVGAKAGVDGKLFGSVTAMDIEQVIIAAGVEIKRADILMPNGPLKTIGEFEVEVLLHHDVRPKIRVNVVAEG